MFRIALSQAADKRPDKNRSDSSAYIIIECIIEKKMFALRNHLFSSDIPDCMSQNNPPGHKSHKTFTFGILKLIFHLILTKKYHED